MLQFALNIKSQSPKLNIGIGATPEHSLRVSTGILALTTFRHPVSGKIMAVFEEKVSVKIDEKGEKVTAQLQPLGGASKLLRPLELYQQIGSFNYDEEKSQKENDFRLQIRPQDWDKVKAFAMDHFNHPEKGVVEGSIDRELNEELGDVLKVEVDPAAYQVSHLTVAVQNEPQQTERIEVSGNQTVRVFSVKGVDITDQTLIENITGSSEKTDTTQLIEKARKKAQEKGSAKATGLVIISLEELQAHYRSLDIKKRDEATEIIVNGKKYKLANNVGVTIP